MNDTKPHRLLIRLGAELSIIVLGVLIALGANEWWADRADRQQEAEILAAISEDIVASQELLRSDLDEQAGVLSHLLTASGGTMGAAAGLSASELDEAIYYALWETPTFRLQMSAYDEAKSSGRLGLLRSPEIRRALAEFEAELVRLGESYDDEMQHQQTKLDPYAI